MGIILLLSLVGIELLFLVLGITFGHHYRKEKNIVRIGELLLLIILLLGGFVGWGFRYAGITFVLTVQTVIAVISLVRGKEKTFRPFRRIVNFILVALLYSSVLLTAILFPQYKEPAVSGTLNVLKAKYTWVDEGRTDPYAAAGEKRKLTVEFWYPEDYSRQKYPLAVFSHGAFGISTSNRSTFVELASNGYVVASIGHTYQAFYTLDTSGKLTLANTDFLNEVTKFQNSESETEGFEESHDWLDLRTGDLSFVLDTLIRLAGAVSQDKPQGELPVEAQEAATGQDVLFSKIDINHIGLFGHSLGGAASAQTARQRNDIDAVIVLDGTMFGEEISMKDGKAVLNASPFPVPLLNIYAQNHYEEAQKLMEETYANFYASRNAVSAEEVVIRGAGHLNFTDLPLFSPFLAKMLGTGTVEPRYCIELVNQIVLNYFNHCLKGMELPPFEKVY